MKCILYKPEKVINKVPLIKLFLNPIFLVSNVNRSANRASAREYLCNQNINSIND